MQKQSRDPLSHGNNPIFSGLIMILRAIFVLTLVIILILIVLTLAGPLGYV